MSSLIPTCIIFHMELVICPVLLGLHIVAACQPFCMFCSIHVASVVQMTHMLLCHGGVIKSGLLTRQAQMSTFWSACVHDFEHGGLNNDFLVKTSHPLAITYNDQSPLENHHHAAAVTPPSKCSCCARNLKSGDISKICKKSILNKGSRLIVLVCTWSHSSKSL